MNESIMQNSKQLTAQQSMQQTKQVAQQLAEQCAQVIFANDAASKGLGCTLQKIDEGVAIVTMVVLENMLNGHKTCHGGFIFALADSAFAFACNTKNFATVASGCSIEFLMPAQLGDVLTAEAVEITRSKKTGIYDVTIHNQENKKVAIFRGKSHQLDKTIL